MTSPVGHGGKPGFSFPTASPRHINASHVHPLKTLIGRAIVIGPAIRSAGATEPSHRDSAVDAFAVQGQTNTINHTHTVLPRLSSKASRGSRRRPWPTTLIWTRGTIRRNDVVRVRMGDTRRARRASPFAKTGPAVRSLTSNADGALPARALVLVYA